MQARSWGKEWNRERKEGGNQRKEKGENIEKDDYDLNVDEEPQRIVIKEEMMKKHMPPLFPKLCMAKSYRASLKWGMQTSYGIRAKLN